ncbi:MAG: GrpB family protein [Rhodoferax sp.]|nr:GrpB family protein [Rhodoferax sp.]
MAFRIVHYSEAWPGEFAIVRSQLLAAFGNPSVRIEHIGSTSVPGLCAKPVIDVLVGAQSLESIEEAIPRLAAAKYEYVKKYEVELPMRRYFVRPESPGLRIHVHAVNIGSEIWNEHLAFRDALRSNTRTREAYAQLKLELARIHADDKAAYTAAKAPFIRQVLRSSASAIASEG